MGDPTLITEKAFATSHHAFWRQLLPMGDRYIRSCNIAVSRFAAPISGTSTGQNPGLINELGFRLFARALSDHLAVKGLAVSVVAEEHRASRTFIETFRQHGSTPLPALAAEGLVDARLLAERTEGFFQAQKFARIETSPRFRGCGWLSEARGDVLADKALYEIKAGARSFRMVDIRQLLVYCALNYSAKDHVLDEIGVVNPRHGTVFKDSIATLCQAVAGRAAMDVLGDIVEYLSTAAGEFDNE